MNNAKSILKNSSKFQKIICLISLLGLVLFFAVSLPTYARFKNRIALLSSKVWDGSIADSYKSGVGSEEDPYEISDPSELAYFYKQLATNDYQNKYFILSNNIILNSGVFNYTSENVITYTINNTTYYVNKYTNKYYSTTDMTGTEAGTLNIFYPLNNFKGTFNGDSHTIYGLYMTSSGNELGLFTNLYGSVNNLYVENSLIYGGLTTGGIASNTIGASLNNIYFKGFVIGENNVAKNVNYNPTTSVINIENTESINNIDLTNNIPFVGSTISSTTITGNYTISGATESETTIKINGTTVSNGSFNINLGTNILNSVSVSTITTSTEPTVTLTFSNLSYNITYNYGVSGGIVGFSNDTNITNVVNKANVYSYLVSGGLVGVTNNILNISNSYNTGTIKSELINGGLVGSIEKSSNNISISNSYNIGDSYGYNIGGLVGEINNNTGVISIENTFNSSISNYCIYNISNSTVNVTNSYFTGSTSVYSGNINGTFSTSTVNDLKSKSYITTNLLYSEFVSYSDLEINSDNVWVFESDRFPILYIDDISNPVALININDYSWNNFSYEVNTLSFNSNVTFSIEDANELSPLKGKYYYISNSSTPLTSSQVSQITTWTEYTNEMQITTAGSYIIYVKAVDNDDNITYLNTDILSLNLSSPVISINLNDNTWSSFNSDLDYTYIDRPSNLTVDVNEDYTMSSILYYVSSTTKTIVDLEALNTEDWASYSSSININQIGSYIIYIKATDTSNNIYYINTGYIIYNGYDSSLIIGRNLSSYQNETANITNKSLITLNFDYTNSFQNYLSGYNHNLITNILLPVGTKITLIDKKMNKTYSYNIPTSSDIYNYNNSCTEEGCAKKATYSFVLFKEVGTNTTNKYFNENFYYNLGTIDEEFTVILDFSNTNISTNYTDVAAYLELRNSKAEAIVPTIYSSIDKFNIYSTVNSEDADASLKLSTTYSNSIILNSDSTNNISITSGLTYKYDNTNKIIDTKYEDKKIGLLLKLVDSEGVALSNEYLKNLSFKVGEVTYTPDIDGLIRINFNDGISDVTKDLVINTYINNSNLEDGTYYLKIYNFVSDDGLYYDSLGSAELSIPVEVTNNFYKDYSFNVLMDDASHIINKEDSSQTLSFKILQNGDLENPNIRVSLYKKNLLTALDQNYSIIELSTLVSDSLTLIGDNVYYVSSNPVIYNGTEASYNNFVLNFITSNLENNGYKLVFELYDGNKKISTINKYFIVK